MTGKGHPLPDSDEARHNEIPEHLERDKGRGDDSKEAVQPAGEAVAPDGEPYRYDDLGRGPEDGEEGNDMADDRRDQVNGDDTRDQDQQAPGAHGTQAGGGPGASDMASPGGSSGAGGYGSGQNQQLHQGQQGRNLSGRHSDEGLSRGERFDEQQGGGRADDAVTITAADRGGGRGKADNDDSIEPDTGEG